MKRNFTRVVIPFLLLLISVTAFAADRFRVTDEVLTVYGDTNYINALGKLHRGDEYEIIGRDGDMYIFMYNGRKAYAAAYCCKLIEADAEKVNAAAPQPTPAVKEEKKEENVQAEEAEPKCDVEELAGDDGAAQPVVVESTGQSNGGRSLREVAEGMKGLLGFLVMIGLVAGVWSLVGSRSFNNLFDRMAGRYVSDCSKWMYFRPAIAFVLFGLIGYYSDNIGLALAVTGVYEIVLLCFRAKKLQSFRAAVAEALYLAFSDMGLLLLFWLFLIFAFLASGGSSSSSDSSDGSKRDTSGNDCRDCDHGPGSPYCVGTPMAGYRCSHYKQCMGPK